MGTTEAYVIKDTAESYKHTFNSEFSSKPALHKYDLLVENLGRSNGGDQMNHERKGILDGDIKLDGNVVSNLTIYSLDFNRTFV